MAVAEVIRLDCADQGVTIKNADFESNRAGRNGGVFSMSSHRKNSVFFISLSTFVNNSAAQKGGVA